MATLHAHLAALGSHDRLSFRPDCPICGTRLQGASPTTALIPARVKGGIAACTVAVATIAPAGMLQPASGIAASGAPGGASKASADGDDLPDTPPPGGNEPEVKTPGPGPASGSATAEPTDDAGSDAAAGGESGEEGGSAEGGGSAGAATPPATSAPAPTVPAATAPGPTAAAPVPVPAAAVPSPVPPAPAPSVVPGPAPVAHPPALHRAPSRSPAPNPRHATPAASSSAPTTEVPTASEPVAAPDPESSAATEESSAPASPARAARSASGVHTVSAGESLWSIARDRLGGRASNSDIAREVHRLWALNAQKIRSGQPDLIPVGLKLRIN